MRKFRVAAGQSVQIPGGRTLGAGTEAVVSDADWAVIQRDNPLVAYEDLGVPVQTTTDSAGNIIPLPAIVTVPVVGPVGPAGAPGPAGPVGDPGPTGPIGPAGAGITYYSPPNGANTTPQSYPEGLSRSYFVNGSGYPGSYSLVLTQRQATDVHQTAREIVPYGRTYERFAWSRGDQWTPWSLVSAGNGDGTVAGDLDWRTVGAAGQPAFLNGWRAESALYPVQFRRMANGMVVLRGLVAAGTVGSVAFVLPGGYRPTMNRQHFPVVSGNAGAHGAVYVAQDGAVVPWVGTNVWFDLAITFHSET